MRDRRRAAITAITGLTLVLSACGGSDDGKGGESAEPSDTRASPTASSTPLPKGLKTPPAVPDLTSAEQSAVDRATATARSGAAAVARLEADPVSAVADRAGTKRVLSTYYLPSYYRGILDTIESFADRGLRLEGAGTQRWSAPVKVDLDAATPVVVLEACTTTEGLSIEGQTGKKKIKIAPTSISRTTFRPDGGGKLLLTWKAEKSDYVGTC